MNSVLHMLGYVAKEGKLLFADKDASVISYSLQGVVLEYQQAALAGHATRMRELQPRLPQQQYAALARFLESLGMKQAALELTPDADHKFDLALQVHDFATAQHLVATSESEERLKQIGDAFLQAGKVRGSTEGRV